MVPPTIHIPVFLLKTDEKLVHNFTLWFYFNIAKNTENDLQNSLTDANLLN